MRGGYTISKGINIPNPTPLVIGQNANAEFSKSIYYPRLPNVKPIPVRQSKDFFGQTGPVASDKNVLYTKLNGGKPSWFAKSRFNSRPMAIKKSTNDASSNPEKIIAKNVSIHT
tara:strand:+ start:298 stop:639 length:342 start_codon:yes stop_codon:yes gene_type:complete